MKRSLPWAAFTGLLIAAGGTTTYVVVQTALNTGQAPPVAAVTGFALLWGGGLALYSREKPPPPATMERPTVVIDWHLTDVCATITCPCDDTPRHMDGYMFGRFRCPTCGRFFQLKDRVDAHERGNK